MSVHLRYFVRLDARGKIVPGSLISRPKRPRMLGSKFMEIFAPNCCITPDVVVSATPTGTPSGSTNVTVIGRCGATQLFRYTAASASNAATVTLLNTNFPGVATWSVVTGTIVATAPICDTFTFTVAYA